MDIYSRLSPVYMCGHSWSYWAPAAASGPSRGSRSIRRKPGNGSSAKRQRERQTGNDHSSIIFTDGKQEKEGDKVKKKKKEKERNELPWTRQYMRIIGFTASIYSSPYSRLRHQINNVYVVWGGCHCILSSALQPYDQQLSVKAFFMTSIFLCL